MNIFACDDEHLALMLLTDAIRAVAPDATIYEFRNPEELLKEARSTRCDVAFLDIEMHGMNGVLVARHLKEMYPRTNIIFVTGYDRYSMDAWDLMVSGYVTKPVRKEKIEEQLANLRYEIQPPRDITVQTFGNFDIFVRGRSICFRRKKSKELIAYLVDRRGAAVSRREIYSALFGNEDFNRSRQNYLSIIAHDTEEDLEAAGAAGLFQRQPSSYSVDTTMFTCDVYDYMRGDLNAKAHFKGEYMRQYPWGQYFKG